MIFNTDAYDINNLSPVGKNEFQCISTNNRTGEQVTFRIIPQNDGASIRWKDGVFYPIDVYTFLEYPVDDVAYISLLELSPFYQDDEIKKQLARWEPALADKMFVPSFLSKATFDQYVKNAMYTTLYFTINGANMLSNDSVELVVKVMIDNPTTGLPVIKLVDHLRYVVTSVAYQEVGSDEWQTPRIVISDHTDITNNILLQHLRELADMCPCF